MIYIPIEIQLRMINEDLKEIKEFLKEFYLSKPLIYANCSDCNLASTFGADTCPLHAPEFRTSLKLCEHEWDGVLLNTAYAGNLGKCKHCREECYIAL